MLSSINKQTNSVQTEESCGTSNAGKNTTEVYIGLDLLINDKDDSVLFLNILVFPLKYAFLPGRHCMFEITGAHLPLSYTTTAITLTSQGKTSVTCG